MKSNQVKDDFCRFCRLLYEKNLVSGVGGNVSMRVRRKLFFTPTGYSLRDLRPEEISVTDEQGTLWEGPEPTKDAGMHLALLALRPSARVICHVHGAHLVAASTLLIPGPDSLPPLTPGFVYYSYPLPMLPFMVPGTSALTEAVREAFSHGNTRAVLLQNHGLVVAGKDLNDALNVVEEINEAAHIFLLARGQGTVIPSEDLHKIS